MTPWSSSWSLGAGLTTLPRRKKRMLQMPDALKGMLKTESQERLQRWVEHLSEILNRDDPTNPVGEKEETGELE